MAPSIEQSRQNVQSAFAEAMAWADAPERRAFAPFESRLWTLLLALGRALVGLFLAHQGGRLRPVGSVTTSCSPLGCRKKASS